MKLYSAGLDFTNIKTHKEMEDYITAMCKLNYKLTEAKIYDMHTSDENLVILGFIGEPHCGMNIIDSNVESANPYMMSIKTPQDIVSRYCSLYPNSKIAKSMFTPLVFSDPHEPIIQRLLNTNIHASTVTAYEGENVEVEFEGSTLILAFDKREYHVGINFITADTVKIQIIAIPSETVIVEEHVEVKEVKEIQEDEPLMDYLLDKPDYYWDESVNVPITAKKTTVSIDSFEELAKNRNILSYDFNAADTVTVVHTDGITSEKIIQEFLSTIETNVTRFTNKMKNENIQSMKEIMASLSSLSNKTIPFEDKVNELNNLSIKYRSELLEKMTELNNEYTKRYNKDYIMNFNWEKCEIEIQKVSNIMYKQKSDILSHKTDNSETYIKVGEIGEELEVIWIHASLIEEYADKYEIHDDETIYIEEFIEYPFKTVSVGHQTMIVEIPQ